MTIEDKMLLIKDLSCRLPYGVQVQDTRCGISGNLHDMLVFPLYKGNDVYDYMATTNFYTDCYYDDIALFKPYLFPLSNMTEEQKEEFTIVQSQRYTGLYPYPSQCSKVLDWLHKNHFDYRGLIEKGLAINATGKNIY